MYRFTFVHRSRQMLYSKQKLENSLDAKNKVPKILSSWTTERQNDGIPHQVRDDRLEWKWQHFSRQILRYNLKSWNSLGDKNKETENLKVLNDRTAERQNDRTAERRDPASSAGWQAEWKWQHFSRQILRYNLKS